MEHLLIGHAEKFGAGSAITPGQREDFFMAAMLGKAPFYSCHVDETSLSNYNSFSLKIWKQSFGFGVVGSGDQGAVTQAPLPLGGFFAQDVALIGVMAFDFAGAGELESFGGPAVRFYLRHDFPSFLCSNYVLAQKS